MCLPVLLMDAMITKGGTVKQSAAAPLRFLHQASKLFDSHGELQGKDQTANQTPGRNNSNTADGLECL